MIDRGERPLSDSRSHRGGLRDDSESVGRSSLFSVPAGLQDNDRNFAIGPRLIGVEVCVGVDEARPESGALVSVGDVSMDRFSSVPDLHVGIGLGSQIVVPLRVLGKSALGGNDDGVVAVGDVEQGCGVGDAGFAPAVLEQQRRYRLAEPGTDTPLPPDAPAGASVEPYMRATGMFQDRRYQR